MNKIKEVIYFLLLLTSLLFLSACVNNEYEVIFNLGYDDLVYETKTILEDQTLLKPIDPKREGYQFLFWTLNDKQYSFNEEVKEDITLVSQWEKVFEVKFYLGYGNSYLNKQLITNNELITKPEDPKRAGYEFLGWFINEEEFNFKTTIEKDILLTAKWFEEEDPIIREHEVVFNLNCGTPNISNQTIKKGSLIKKPANPTKEGYVFLGWYVNDSLFDFNEEVKEDITLVAKWELIDSSESFFVAFNSDGGNYTPKVLKVLKGEIIKKPIAPVKEGCLFLGWHYGDDLFDFNKGITNNYLLKANWVNIEENKVFINNFKDLEINDKAIISGVITSFNAYKYLTIEDESAAISILVEDFNTTTLKELNFKVGNKIILEATKDLKNGLILGKTNINKIENTNSFSSLPSAIDLKDVNLNELTAYQSKLVSHNNLIIRNITNKDDQLIFTLFNGSETVNAIYETRYLFEDYEYLFNFMLKDIVKIEKMPLSFDGEAFISLGDAGEIIKIGEEENEYDEQTFNIFYLNDTHGAIMNNGRELGMARIGNYIKKTGNENSIFLTGGDMFQGQLISNANKGALMIEIFNNLNLDAFVIGNHEFDWGLDVILEYFDPETTGVKAEFPILGANVKQKINDQRPEFIDSHTIIKRGNYKIGIVGVIGDGQESSIARLKVEDYYFSDAYNAVKDTVNKIKDEVDFILVGNHDNNQSFNQRVSALPKVSAIFNGHTHRRDEGYLDNVPYIQSGSSGEYVGQIDLTYEKEGIVTLIDSDVNNIYNHPYLNNEDEEISFIIDSYYDEISHLYEQIIIQASRSLSRNDLALFAAKLMAEITGSVFGFQNSGGTRSNISRGNITGSDIFKVFPFENSIISAQIKGSDLKDLYNQSSNTYLNISYSSINNNEFYKVATNEYLFYSEYNEKYFGDVYNDFTEHGTLYEAFYNYLLTLKESGVNYFDPNNPIQTNNPIMNMDSYYDNRVFKY